MAGPLKFARTLCFACALAVAAGAAEGQPGGGGVQLDAAGTQEREVAIKGAIGGIGAELTQSNGTLLIKATMADGPAARAGLQPGTAILRINGVETTGMQLRDAVKLLRGPEGTKVTLDLRSPAGETQSVELVRARIVLGKPDASMCAGEIGLVGLTTFNAETGRAVQEAVGRLRAQGAKALVLDLRGAGGGEISAIQQVASLFLPGGSPLWLQEQKSGERTLVKASETASAMTMPLAVLVDQDTQAAELLAGAIKRNRRGSVIGHKTSGNTASKALVKGPDGSSKLVPFGTFLMSPGEPISGVGVTPDRELPAGAEPAEFVRTAITELKKALAAEPGP